jgi:hypothetical protein
MNAVFEFQPKIIDLALSGYRNAVHKNIRQE